MEPILSRRDRKKHETKQKIVKVAMYLFRTQGYEKTTMEQIAEEVDVSKGTLYNYFPVKESIISSSWQEGIKEIKLQILELIQLLPDTKSRLMKTFNKAATEMFRSKQDIYKIYLNYWLSNLSNQALDEKLKSGLEDIFIMIIKLGIQSGDIRKDIHIELMARQLELMFLNACISWLSDPKAFPLEQSLANTASMFTEGAGPVRRRAKSNPDKGEDKGPSQGTLL